MREVTRHAVREALARTKQSESNATLTGAGLLVLMLVAVLLNSTHEALEASRLQTRNLVDHAPDGIFLADLHGRYTHVNDAGSRMLGFAREEISSLVFIVLFAPSGRGLL